MLDCEMTMQSPFVFLQARSLDRKCLSYDSNNPFAKGKKRRKSGSDHGKPFEEGT